MSFVHLHVHTNFSFGDGAGRIDELVDAARRLGMPALAVTDHDGLYGAVRFYQACKAAGVKPIVGVEISVESILAGGKAEAALGRGSSGGAATAGPLAPGVWSAGHRSGLGRGRAGEGGVGGEGEL